MRERSRLAASAVITTRNRADALQVAIRSLIAQSNVELDIIVMDDCSSDGTAELMRQRFPQVRVCEHSRHHERLRLRNRAFEMARFEAVLCLDDDCYFTSSTLLADALERFYGDASVVAVGLPMIEPFKLTDKRHLASLQDGEELRTFLGGASILRRSAFIAAGGYREFLVAHHEERDLSLRMMDRGARFLFVSGAPIVHTQHPQRQKNEQVYGYIRNMIVISYLNLPLLAAARHIIAGSVNVLLFAFEDRPRSLKLKALWAGFAMCWRFRNERSPVSWSAYLRSRRLPSHGPIYWDRGGPVPANAVPKESGQTNA